MPIFGEYVDSNPNAWYDELTILKIWEQYITKEKGLKYFFYDEKKGQQNIQSLFIKKDEGKEGVFLFASAGILLESEDKLYKRKDGCTVSICNVISEYVASRKSEVAGFDLVRSHLEMALNQIKFWKANKAAKIEKHIIVFPYNLGTYHWCLGTLQINFEKTILKASLNVYDPFSEINKFSDNIVRVIKGILEKIFTSYLAITLSNKNTSTIAQQSDCSSCGVITAENGKDIIDGFEGSSDEKRLNKCYPTGTRQLRIKHLEEINDDSYSRRQYMEPIARPESPELLKGWPILMNNLLDILNNCEDVDAKKDFDKFLEELRKKGMSEQNESEMVLKFKELCSKYQNKFERSKHGDLFNLFFYIDPEDCKCRGSKFDTLKHILRGFVKREKSESSKGKDLIDYQRVVREQIQPTQSEYLKSIDINKYSYHYPERIPNLVRREYLENRIRDELDKNKIAILTGFRGFGKTVLAMEYVYKHLNNTGKYDYIIWLNCQELYSDSQHLVKEIKYVSWDKGKTDLGSTIKYLFLGKTSEETSDNNRGHNITDIHKLITKEVSGKNWLVVYDNVAVARYSDLLQDSIPPNGHIICTSRYKEWPGSINVGPFTKEEGRQYFTNIFFQSPDLAAIEQYRDKYFENMLGTANKAERFNEAAVELTEKLHGYPLALAIVASDIRESGVTVEKYRQEKRYKELFKSIKLDEFIGTNLADYKEDGNKAKELLSYCAYLNHEGITREILEKIDKKVKGNKFNPEMFNKALNLLISLSILNTDSSHATDYYYIPTILEKQLLQETKDNIIPDVILEIINEKLKNHILDNCSGEEFILPAQNIYMWVAHAKKLFKNLEWRKQFSVFKNKNENSYYNEDDIHKLINLFIKSELLCSKKTEIKCELPELATCLFIGKDNKEQMFSDVDDGCSYYFLISQPLVDVDWEKVNPTTDNESNFFKMLNKTEKIDDRYKILIPYLDKDLDYWVTLEIKFNIFKQMEERASYKIQMIAHDPYGHGDVLKNRLEKVKAGFFKYFENVLTKVQSIEKNQIAFSERNSSFNPQLPENDTASSGVVAVANVLELIHGHSPTMTYSADCKLLRYQHLAFIERYINTDGIMYKIDERKLHIFESFLRRHWGFEYLLDNLKNTETFVTTAKFIHFLGCWYYDHEKQREKSYECFLESKILYFQLICAKVLGKSNQQVNYDKIYNNHLTDSYNFEITNDQLLNFDYKENKEVPAIHIQLRDLIKGYLQLGVTYKYYLNNTDIFTIQKQEARWEKIRIFCYLTQSLYKARKGIDENTKEWMYEIHKLFSKLLNGSFGILNNNDNTLIKLIPQDIRKRVLYDKLVNELGSNNLIFFEHELDGVSEDDIKYEKLKKFINDKRNSIIISEKVLKHYRAYDKEKFGSDSEVRKHIFDKLIAPYISNYYGILLAQIRKIYEEFFNYVGSVKYHDDSTKAEEVKAFVELFIKSKEFASESQIKENKINVKLINAEHFYSNYKTLKTFYEMVFRMLALNFMEKFDEEACKALNAKKDKLCRFIRYIIQDMEQHGKDVLDRLSFERLRIKMQLEFYRINSFVGLKNDSTKNFAMIKCINELTSNYFKKIIENFSDASDMGDLSRSSNRLFYKIAKEAFKYLKVTNNNNLIYKLKHFRKKDTNKELFKIIIDNLYRTFIGHKFMLLQPEHRCLIKAKKLYVQALKYKRYIIPNSAEIDIDEKDNFDDIDVDRIENVIDLQLLENKLTDFKRYLTSYHTLEAKSDYVKACEVLSARLNRAITCYTLCRYEEAIFDCNKLCEEDKAYFKAFLLRAHVYYKLKKYPEAIKDFKYYLTYRPGDYNAKVWLDSACKKEELKREYTPLPHITKKVRFTDAFTDEFLIQAKYYADVFLGTNKILNKSEKAGHVMGAISNLVPDITVSGPTGPVMVSADVKLRETAIALSNIYTEQAEAKKQYIASNIFSYHNELKIKVRSIAENIADDLEPQINQLRDNSLVKFAQYSARKMLRNVGLNKTNPELPIEEQLRQGLFRWTGLLAQGKRLFVDNERSRCWFVKKIWLCNGTWTAEGVLTRSGILSTSGHLWKRRGFWDDSTSGKHKYRYRYGSDEEAYRLGYKQKRETKNLSLPFFKDGSRKTKPKVEELQRIVASTSSETLKS